MQSITLEKNACCKESVGVSVNLVESLEFRVYSVWAVFKLIAVKLKVRNFQLKNNKPVN